MGNAVHAAPAGRFHVGQGSGRRAAQKEGVHFAGWLHPAVASRRCFGYMKPPISMSPKGTAEQDLRHSEVSEQWEQMTVAHWLSVLHASCKEQLQGSWSV